MTLVIIEHKKNIYDIVVTVIALLHHLTCCSFDKVYSEILRW